MCGVLWQVVEHHLHKQWVIFFTIIRHIPVSASIPHSKWLYPDHDISAEVKLNHLYVEMIQKLQPHHRSSPKPYVLHIFVDTFMTAIRTKHRPSHCITPPLLLLWVSSGMNPQAVAYSGQPLCWSGWENLLHHQLQERSTERWSRNTRMVTASVLRPQGVFNVPLYF